MWKQFSGVLACALSMVLVGVSPALALLPIAHRGEHQHHQEDTVSSINGAYAAAPQGYTESDIWWVADDVAMALHNATLGAQTPCTGYVSKKTSTYLKAHCPIDGHKNLPTQPMPTLDEELDAVQNNPGQQAVFDLRGTKWDGSHTTRLYNDLARRKMVNRVWLMTASDWMTGRIEKVEPALRTVYRRKCRPTCEITATAAKAMGVSAVMLPAWSWTAGRVSRMHVQGLQTWSAEGDWATLSRMGIDRVMTNRVIGFGDQAR